MHDLTDHLIAFVPAAAGLYTMAGARLQQGEGRSCFCDKGGTTIHLTTGHKCNLWPECSPG